MAAATQSNEARNDVIPVRQGTHDGSAEPKSFELEQRKMVKRRTTLAITGAAKQHKLKKAKEREATKSPTSPSHIRENVFACTT